LHPFAHAERPGEGHERSGYRELLAIVGMASETNRLVAALGVPIDEAYAAG